MSSGRPPGQVALALPWEAVVARLSVGVALVEPDGRLVWANPSFERLVNPARLPEAVRGRVLTMNGEPRPEGTGRLESRTGEELACTLVPLQVEDRWVQLVELVPPPTQPRDALTGLALRDALLERLGQALARQARRSGEVELVMLDLDRFKTINDRYGHRIGDDVLVEVAARLLAASRPEDTVARWGGDEFILLLDDPSVVGGEAVVTRIRAALDIPVPTSAGPLHVTGSLGWVRALAGEPPIELLHRADMRMYKEKRARVGRTTAPELRERLARAQARAQALHEVSERTVRRARSSTRDS